MSNSLDEISGAFAEVVQSRGLQGLVDANGTQMEWDVPAAPDGHVSLRFNELRRCWVMALALPATSWSSEAETFERLETLLAKSNAVRLTQQAFTPGWNAHGEITLACELPHDLTREYVAVRLAALRSLCESPSFLEVGGQQAVLAVDLQGSSGWIRA
jgi:hypothetical protein